MAEAGPVRFEVTRLWAAASAHSPGARVSLDHRPSHDQRVPRISWRLVCHCPRDDPESAYRFEAMSAAWLGFASAGHLDDV